MKCVRTYEWDGLDGGKSYVDQDSKMITKVDESETDHEHMQKFKPQTPPMLYCAMFNKK